MYVNISQFKTLKNVLCKFGQKWIEMVNIKITFAHKKTHLGTFLIGQMLIKQGNVQEKPLTVRVWWLPFIISLINVYSNFTKYTHLSQDLWVMIGACANYCAAKNYIFPFVGLSYEKR